MLNFGNNILQFNVCYVLHALCCHFHYSLPDVLHMNGFTLAVHLEYEHTYIGDYKKKRIYEIFDSIWHTYFITLQKF